MQLAFRAHDGRAVPSRFSGEIMELLGPEPSAVVAWSEQATTQNMRASLQLFWITQRLMICSRKSLRMVLAKSTHSFVSLLSSVPLASR